MSYHASTSPSEYQEVIRRLEGRNQALDDELILAQTELHHLRNQNRQIQEQLTALAQSPAQCGTILDLVKDSNMAIVMIRGSNQVFRVSYPPDIAADMLTGTMVTLHHKTLAITGTLSQPADSFVRSMEVIRKPDITFQMIGGLNDAIMLVIEAIQLSLTEPELFEEIGIDPPKGILLYGPPGTGKTMIAKALAQVTQATFIGLAAPELAQKFIGDGARLVREIFQFARKNTPAIIFIDEIDAIAMRRSDHPTEGNTEIHRTFLQLLAELDGFNERGNIKFVAATNRPDLLDKAITRPGRFDRKIEIPLPDEEGRAAIFQIHTKRMKLKNPDFKQLAVRAVDFNGAEIKAVCTESGMIAIRARKKYIEMGDLFQAIDNITKKHTAIKTMGNQYL